MSSVAEDAVRQVLREASDHDSFNGMSFAQRLNWMISRGYELGRRDEKRAKIPAKDALPGRDLQEVVERLAAIDRSLTNFKGALGRGIGAILMNVTELPDDEIKQWVFGNMLRPTETMNGGQ